MSALGLDLAAGLSPVQFAAGLGFEAEPWQRKLLVSPAQRQVLNCSRQVGKTTAVAIKALHTAVYRRDALILVFSPSQRQSDEMLLRIKSMYRTLGRAKASKDSGSELLLESGSRIVSLPGTESTTRGFAAARLVILDEAARVPDDIFAAVVPMVASDGVLMALSTPWGRRGWFFELHQDVQNGWERHKVTCYESGQYTPERIAEMKALVGSFTFASEYECVFGDTDSQMFGTEIVRACMSDDLAPMEF